MISSTAHPNIQTRSETFRTAEIKIKSVVRSKKMLMVFELWDLPPTTDCLAPELIFFSKFLLASLKISEANYSSLSLGHIMANKSTSSINLCTCMSVCVCMRNRVSECGCIMVTFLFSILYLPGISFNLYNNPINSNIY